MSVLSSTRGDPELLYAVLRLLQARGEPLATTELRDWLQPGLERYPGSLLGDTLGVARSLGLVQSVGKSVELTSEEPLDAIVQLADRVHLRLCTCTADDPDLVLYQTFAWFVVQCEKNGQTTQWIEGYSRRSDLADEIDQALRTLRPDQDARVFNDSKYASWSNWLHFTGLACDLGKSFGFYPFVYERLKRELARVSHDLGLRKQLDLEIVLQEVARAMPYLDGGRIFADLSSALRWQQPPRKLTLVLSTALRELHDLEEIELVSKGDMADAFALAEDRYSRVGFARWIVLKEGLFS
ncbi:MAG: hypothetical protein AB7S38_14795 [Vulcanimicrobiota bacterium]